MKMDKALDMLRFSRLRINQVAGTVSFNDPYFFSRTFRKMFGTSPREWKRINFCQNMINVS